MHFHSQMRSYDSVHLRALELISWKVGSGSFHQFEWMNQLSK